MLAKALVVAAVAAAVSACAVSPVQAALSATPAVHMSDFLARGDPAGAKEAARVAGVLPGDPFSYSGYFTVDNATQSNMFYWYFPAQSGAKDAPLIMWLQGGPGGSSLFGLFVENGPYEITSQGTLVPRRVGNWNGQYSMLYVDNPVGTGFSYTTKEEGYCNDETCVARNLYSLMQQFFTVFPEERQNDFYVSGESYAGKYIPAFTHYILTKNNEGREANIPLKGMTIGDGLCDPISQIQAYPDTAYFMGLVDLDGRQKMRQYTDGMHKAILHENWKHATQLFNELINGQWHPSYFTNVTGISDYFDIRRTTTPEAFNYFAPYVNRSDIRAKLHVGSHYFYQSNVVYDHLAEDLCKSVKHYIPALLDNYKVLFYSGQFDFIVAAPTTEEFLRSLEWAPIEGFIKAPREIWYTGENKKTKAHVSGYAKKHKNLTYVLVRDAGHIGPFDQPIRVLDMVETFIGEKPWSGDKE